MINRIVSRMISTANNKLINNNNNANATTVQQLLSQIPQPQTLPIIGSTLALLLNGGSAKLHEYIDKRHKQLGNIFIDQLGPTKCVFILDPNDMRKVFNNEGKYPAHIYPEAWKLYNQLKNCERGLFFMDGTEWLVFRRIMNKTLLREDLETFYEPCRIVADNVTNIWLESQQTEVLNLHDILYRWSVESVTSILLGTHYMKNHKKLQPSITKLVRVMQDVFETTSKISLIPADFAYKFKLPAWRRFETAVDLALDRANALSSMILDMHENGGGVLERLLENGISKKDSIRVMTDLLLAAGDTTAHTMEWLLYLLAKNPNIQNDIYRESLTVPDMNDPPALLKGAVREALRLYPVAPFLNRILPNDINIQGYDIPAGTLLILSLYSSGRCEKYFNSPEKFWPERWLRCDLEESMNFSNLRAAVAHASMPFAMGSRSCIGKKLAEAQMYVTIRMILNKFSLELLNTNNIEMIMRLVGVPSEPIRIALHKR